MEEKYWNPREFPYEELKSLQWERLKRQLQYCYDTSPLFYRKKFDSLGLKPGDIKTWDDFHKLPVMGNKEEERMSQEQSMKDLGHPFGTYLCADFKDFPVVSPLEERKAKSFKSAQKKGSKR